MQAQRTFAGLVALGLSSALLPLGCGGAAEDYVVVQPSTSESTTSSDWSIPESAVEQMRSCLKEHAHELNTSSHEAKLDLVVTEDGDVQKVRLRSSTLHHDALESCLMQALAAVSVPSSALTLRSSGPVSGGEWSRDARGPLGVAQALAGAAAAGPIILMALGVTIAVYVAAVATEQAIEAVSKRRKLEKLCKPFLYACLANPWQPSWNRKIFGDRKQCEACYFSCIDKGNWPELKCPSSN